MKEPQKQSNPWLDETHERFSATLGRLAHILNTDVLESWGYKPFVFAPEWNNGVLWWKIETLTPMVDPGDVAEYLEERLLKRDNNGSVK